MAAPGPALGPSLRPSVERYLRERPEVAMLLRGLLREVMLRRPRNVLEFAAEYFTDPELPRRIWDQLGTDPTAAAVTMTPPCVTQQ
ncbi:RIIa domain-containing protein 1 isoform X3 [Gallus gallus]|uniref:RIIa domain-containing protein 1 isoform X3 n=1 Tax=Gallus gallus TaxID=9031 RepID=UPI000739CB6E|nr:RIIa domain-containing protein 1 isoform X3 [Gallus gallus]XP_040547006.1 RIIa domain-containing protein 1 isoform X3 [Gallus gallus]|eukprot:XP_015135510.1 RIIa domain-containing protein 1 isoform X2 [Gallus gallus]